MHTHLVRLSVFALLAAFAASAAGQEPVRKAIHFRAKQILGAKVSISGGASVGTVDDFILSDEGVVDYLIVNEGGKLVTVPWEVARFDFEKRTATIEITRERYKEIPTFTVETYPSFYAPEYRTRVYKYYGVTPGARRLERRIEKGRP